MRRLGTRYLRFGPVPWLETYKLANDRFYQCIDCEVVEDAPTLDDPNWFMLWQPVKARLASVHDTAGGDIPW